MLTGVVADISIGSIVLDVGGVGYLVRVQTITSLTVGTSLSLHTYLAVREDALDLYGFSTRDDLAMFELLIELPKIGPKSALAILSQANIELLKKSVMSNDPVYLAKMSGIGKKTAEKIVLGLKEKFDGTFEQTGGNREASDVIDALIALGYDQKEARDAVLKLDPTLPDTNARVKEALRSLSR